MRMLNSISKNEMKDLTTVGLLAYRNRILKCRETRNWDDSFSEEMTKESDEWKQLYADVKEVLAEHRLD